MRPWPRPTARGLRHQPHFKINAGTQHCVPGPGRDVRAHTHYYTSILDYCCSIQFASHDVVYSVLTTYYVVSLYDSGGPNVKWGTSVALRLPGRHHQPASSLQTCLICSRPSFGVGVGGVVSAPSSLGDRFIGTPIGGHRWNHCFFRKTCSAII